MLAVEIDNHPGIARQVSEIPGVVCNQNGEHEKTFLFDVSLFEQVVAIVKPYVRRHLTDEQKEAGALRLAEYRERINATEAKTPLEPSILPQAGGRATETELEP